MNTVKKAAVLTAAACAMVMSGAGVASADGNDGATAEAAAIGSPGFLSGNIFQLPINAPTNVCGNSLGLFGLLNPSFGNTCVNASVRGDRFRHRGEFRERGFCEEAGEWGGHDGFDRRDGFDGRDGRFCGRFHHRGDFGGREGFRGEGFRGEGGEH